MEKLKKVAFILVAIVAVVTLFYSGGYKSWCMVALGILAWHAIREKERSEALSIKREEDKLKL